MTIGQFDPIRDTDAALKISVDSLLLDRRFGDLEQLLDGDCNVTGLEGEPGWTLELRDSDDPAFFPDWPEDAHVHAAVDPEVFALSHPDWYGSITDLVDFVRDRLATSPGVTGTPAYRTSGLRTMLR